MRCGVQSFTRDQAGRLMPDRRLVCDDFAVARRTAEDRVRFGRAVGAIAFADRIGGEGVDGSHAYVAFGDVPFGGTIIRPSRS